MEEVFAGFLTHCDENIGTGFSIFLEQNNLMETLCSSLSQTTGASQEGLETGRFNESLYFNRSRKRSRWI